jgi:polyisoprenoid-binding protein YceI
MTTVKQKRSAVLALGALLFSAQGFSATEKNYAVDGAHSSASFKVKHLMSKTSGNFKDFSGTFTFDEKNPKAFKGSFVVKADTIFTNEAKRDEHLKSADFFNVEKHPTLSFVAKELKAAGKNKYKMLGDFTMLGVTKTVSFDMEYLGTGKDPWGNEKVGFSASGKINRKDYGMVWNKALDTGGFLVGDEVEIDVQVEGNAQK